MNRAAIVFLLAAIFPVPSQGYTAGDVVKETDFDKVSEMLKDVLHADGDVDVGRRCAVGVVNLGSSQLVNPRWYLYSGSIHASAPHKINKGETGLSLFYKKSYATYGTNGLLSYEISGTDYKLVIMWEVPWNSLVYDSTFNTKIYHKNIPVNKVMYNQMNDYSGPMKRNEGWMEKVEYGIKTRASLNGDSLARFYVSIDADDHNRFLPPELHTECDLQPTWFGKYCWQECSPNGYCWVDKKCSKDSDCKGPLQCYDPCKKTS